MLSNYWRVMGISVAIMILFSCCVILVIAYMGIENPYARIVTGKTLSLFALAAFGQSEALKIYLQNHQMSGIGILGTLNQIGAALAIVVALLLVWKIYAIEHKYILDESLNHKQGIISWIDPAIYTLLKHSEITSLTPLFFFAGINLLLWAKKIGGEQIGKVCFFISDMPVLLPIVGAISLISMIEGYGSESYKLLVGGATIMLIFSSMILNECTKVLLHND